MKTKIYKDYVEKYKSYDAGYYFYAKDELLNKLYGFDDRGEFTIEVLDEMINLQSKIDKALEYIEENILDNKIEKVNWEFDDCCYSDMPVTVIKPLIDILKGDE